MLDKLLKEMATSGSTGAGGIAAVHGSLFGGGIIDRPPSKKRKKKRKLAEKKRFSEMDLSMERLKESLNINNDKNDYDPADVVSKLDAAHKKAKTDSDTATFGLEDENGNVVKVYVAYDQANEFEQALETLLSDEDTDDDNQNTSFEIAEILYKLKNKFDIVDVDWGRIEGDEEQEEGDLGEEGDESEGSEDTEADEGEGEGEGEGEDAEMTADEQAGEGDEGGEDLSSDMEDEDMGGESDTEAAKSALSQIIDMMKADAEAKQAEAQARTAEAKAKEAEYMAKATESKVKQEEEVLDMEAYYDSKKKQDSEAKQIAKLAKYKHDLAADKGAGLSLDDSDDISEEQEEDKISTEELLNRILTHLRSQ